MSKFDGWLGEQMYHGVQGERAFLDEWIAIWDDWDLEAEALLDAADKVVALMRQSGRSKLSGVRVDMSFAQVWTLRDGKQALMEMYSDRDKALEAVGLAK